jgi:hypothetical protein
LDLARLPLIGKAELREAQISLTLHFGTLAQTLA